MEQFIQSNAVWLAVGAFAIAIYLIIKTVRNLYENDWLDAAFIISLTCILGCGGFVVYGILAKDWICFNVGYGFLAFLSIVGIICFFVGKYQYGKKIEDSPDSRARTTQRELEERIEQAKEKMKVK